jgi:hypothetical protein
MTGKKHNMQSKIKQKLTKQGSKNPMWKGNNVKYRALHSWIEKNKIKPSMCIRCKKNKPYDLANISGEYKRDVNDYEWLCRKCHMQEDGRLLKAKIRLSNKSWNKKRSKK